MRHPVSKRRSNRNKGRRWSMAAAGEAAGRLLAALGGGGKAADLALWRHWPEVLGPELAQLARPLERRGATLVLGMEDAIVAQELSYFQLEILARVNAFVHGQGGKEPFDRVTFELLRGRVPLDRGRSDGFSPAPMEHPRPRSLGGLARLLAEDSPQGRAYRAYIGFFAGGRGHTQ